MSTIRLRRRGPASKYDIWARYRDPERWREWAPLVREVRASGWLRPGLEGELRTSLGVVASFDVLEVDEGGGRWIWVVRSGPVRYRVEHEVAEGMAGMVITAPAAALLASIPVARRALARVVRRDGRPGRPPA